MQVGAACAESPQCFKYRLEDRPGSLSDLGTFPGVPEATAALGFVDFEHFRYEARLAVEAVYLLATFCLTPSGDSPKRRGFYDAVAMGCACCEM